MPVVPAIAKDRSCNWSERPGKWEVLLIRLSVGKAYCEESGSCHEHPVRSRCSFPGERRGRQELIQHGAGSQLPEAARQQVEGPLMRDLGFVARQRPKTPARVPAAATCSGAIRAVAALRSQPHVENQREQHVELLFDRERPGVDERVERNAEREIAVRVAHQVEVADAKERRQRGPLVGCAQPGVRDEHTGDDTGDDQADQ